jgi:predicted thioredoxin/glutaredoxin
MSDNTQGDKPASEGGHAIIRSIQTKMHNLVQEFGAGKVSNEQFNILYERFNSQLSVAMSLSDAEASQSSDVSTMLIREATTGRAVGLGVYHHPSSTIIETLGNFDIPPAVLTPTLNGLSARIDNNEYLEPKVQKSPNWLLDCIRDETLHHIYFVVP